MGGENVRVIGRNPAPPPEPVMSDPSPTSENGRVIGVSGR